MMKQVFNKRLSLAVMCCICLFISCSCGKQDSSPKSKADDTYSYKESSISIVKGNTSVSFDSANNSLSFSSGSAEMCSLPEGEITGLNRLSAISPLSITVINDKGETEKVYSFSDATYELYGFNSSNEKFRIVYDFSKFGVKVPLDFSMSDEQAFSVSVPTLQIEDKENKLLDISFLPYLGAGSIYENGYILIPDGSGAGIRFNNGKSIFGTANYSVYGTDAMSQKDYKEINANYVNLPMYAFLYEDTSTAFTAFVDKGDAMASLTTSVGSGDCPYSTAYFTFNYRPYTLATLLDRTNKAQKFYIASKSVTSCEAFSVTYKYFDEQSGTLKQISDYVGKKVFGNREKQKQTEMKAYLDVYLSVYKRVYTAGVPHNANVALTTLKECSLIADDFQNPVMMLRGLDEYGAISGPIDKEFKISGTVGKSKDYQTLSSKATLYNVCEFTQYNKSSIGFSASKDSSRSVTGKAISRYDYNPATLLSANQSISILNPLKINNAVSKYIKSISGKSVTGIAPISLCSFPYTNDKVSDRQNTTKIFKDSLKKSKNANLELLLYNPDAFSLKYGNKAICLPTSSSGQSLIDFDIPFIQMVVRNYLDYSGESINCSGDVDNAILSNAKTGSNPCFSITMSDYKTIRDTELDYLYAADYRTSGKSFVSLYQDYKARMKPCVGKEIVNYYFISDYVSVTEFSGNVKVYVNSSEQDYLTNSGKTVKSADYLVEVS